MTETKAPDYGAALAAPFTSRRENIQSKLQQAFALAKRIREAEPRIDFISLYHQGTYYNDETYSASIQLMPASARCASS